MLTTLSSPSAALHTELNKDRGIIVSLHITGRYCCLSHWQAHCLLWQLTLTRVWTRTHWFCSLLPHWTMAPKLRMNFTSFVTVTGTFTESKKCWKFPAFCPLHLVDYFIYWFIYLPIYVYYLFIIYFFFVFLLPTRRVTAAAAAAVGLHGIPPDTTAVVRGSVY